MKCGFSPASSIARLMAAPPPWTTTGRMPTVSMNTMSKQQVPQRVVVLHHAAAQLDDRDLVAELADPLQGLDQHVGLLDGLRFGQRRSST